MDKHSAQGRDLDLVQLYHLALAGLYEVYQFAERVEGGAFGFDYTLRPGPVYTRNAIRLLELTGFPEPLTREARALAGP